MGKKFKDRDMTVIAMKQIDFVDYEADEILDRGVSYLEEIASVNFFFDGLRKYVKLNQEKLNFQGNINEVAGIYELVKRCYKDEGFIGDKGKGKNSYNPSSVKSWITGKRMPSREEAYRFRFCLNMNLAETEEFLFKGCLMKPFNFKDIPEAVFYYCLNTGRNYQRALEIIDIINTIPDKSLPYPDNDTVSIGNRIKNITEEEELVTYICENKEGFKEQSRKAVSVLKKQIARSAEFAEWERSNFFEDCGIPRIESEKDIPAIVNVILGYETRANEKGKDVYTQKIKNSTFPEVIKRNFPQPQQINSVLKDDVPSVETLRKTIILFVFYNMFAELRKNRIECLDGEYFAEFADELDAVLEECGYVQMYWRNPYDWMFGYCARAAEPLDELRELIEYYYLDNSEVHLLGN